MSDNITLNFINRSHDTASHVVIFQQNTTPAYDTLVIAWKVFEQCGPNYHHQFHFGWELEVLATDSWGNHTLGLPADYGQAFEVVEAPTGNIIQPASTPATAPNTIEIRNALKTGSVIGDIFRNGKILSTKPGIEPGEKAVFHFSSVIYIGAVSEIAEGNVIPADIVASIDTQLDLTGLASADIVMTGGGNEPFAFHLENEIINH